MPTRKQRRRRAKERRHEWEEVYLDEEGREVPVETIEAGRGDGKTRSTDGKASRAAARPQARQVQPPSWRRVTKRALMFAPFMFVFIWILEPDTPALARVLYAVQLMLLFIPFSYLIETVTYRAFKRRLERAESGGAAPRT